MPLVCLGVATPGADATSYTTSKLWTESIPALAAGIIAAFGAGHVLAHRELLDDQWTTVSVNLPTGVMLAGASAAGLELGASGTGSVQLPATISNPALAFASGQTTWTRTATATGLMLNNNKVEVSGAGFVAIDGQTGAPVRMAPTATAGLRPYFLYR
jgi:hypothetical protein